MQIHILKKEETYLIHTINWIGITFSDYCDHEISFDIPRKTPYICVNEGIVTKLQSMHILKIHNNIDIVKNGCVVIRKRMNDDAVVCFVANNFHLVLFPA